MQEILCSVLQCVQFCQTSLLDVSWSLLACSPLWPFPYLVGVGLVLLLHSFRSRATSWVTPRPPCLPSSMVPCLLGAPSSSGTWYCQLHHHRDLYIWCNIFIRAEPIYWKLFMSIMQRLSTHYYLWCSVFPYPVTMSLLVSILISMP